MEAPASVGNATTVEPVAIARAISAGLLGMPGVAGISPGRFGLTGTFGTGDMVPGIVVSIQNDMLDLEIHIVASMPIVVRLPELAQQIREIAVEILGELPSPPIHQIDIAIDDLQEEGRFP